MTTTFPRSTAPILIVALWLLSASIAAAGTKTCLTGTDPEVASDPGLIGSMRAFIDAQCACASFDGSKGKARGDYMACVSLALRNGADTVGLRPQCRGTVKGYFAKNTCGTLPSLNAQPCIARNLKSGRLSCAIKATTKKDGTTPLDLCASNDKVARDSCDGLTSCIDAADFNRDLRIAAPGDTGGCGCPSPSDTRCGGVCIHPYGSYALSCIDCQAFGCDLSCNCATASGHCYYGSEDDECPRSTITLPCAGDIANIDGRLVCQ